LGATRGDVLSEVTCPTLAKIISDTVYFTNTKQITPMQKKLYVTNIWSSMSAKIISQKLQQSTESMTFNVGTHIWSSMSAKIISQKLQQSTESMTFNVGYAGNNRSRTKNQASEQTQ
jgi:hypothetical protein